MTPEEIETIDGYLRTALNEASDSVPEGSPILDLEQSKEVLRERLRVIKSWPDSPEPDVFPFVQKSGSQIQ